MNLLVTVYVAGIGLFACIFFAVWLVLRKGGSIDDFFLPAFLLAIAWPVTIVALFAMLIVRLAEKEGGVR